MRDDGDGRVDDSGIGCGVQNTVTIVTTDTGSGYKVKGADLRVEISVGNTTRTPLLYTTENTCRVEEMGSIFSCLTASEIKFREAMRLPFSKGNEHWGVNRS